MGGSRTYQMGEVWHPEMGVIYKFLISWFVIFLIIISSISLINTSANAGTKPSDNPEIEFLNINSNIHNNYAITDIQTKFKNPNDYAIDSTFSFMIPEKAFISNFSLSIDNKIHYAQIVPKDVAREKFEEAVLNGTDAGLMESSGKNLFSYSVSLSPQQELLVGLRYEQFLEKSLGGYEYIIPLEDGTANKFVQEFSIEIALKSKPFITDLKIENYRESALIDWVYADTVLVSYQSFLTTPQDDFIMTYELANPPVNGSMLNYNDGTDEFFFHVFSPQRTDLGNEVMPKEIIFVLDKSGSMDGRKIQQLKTAFEHIIDELPAQDTFNIIMFDNKVIKYNQELITATEENKADAVEYINGISAGGSTNINEALSTALDMFKVSETKVPIIVMLTDGLPTAGVTNTASIRENIKTKNEAKVAVFCLGFGFDVDFEFLKSMSLENYAIAQRIYEGEDASEQITGFYDTISTPLLRGLRFKYSEGAHEIYPTQVSQLFEGSEVVVVGKYSGASKTIASSIEATSWDGTRTFKEDFTIEENSSNSFIPRFWAYAKIMHLLDEVAINGENESLKENITNLAMTYSFVTPYTSLYVEILEDEPDNKRLLDEFPDDSYSNVGPDLNRPKKDTGGDGDSEDNVEGLDSTMISCPIIFFILAIIIIIALVIKTDRRIK